MTESKCPHGMSSPTWCDECLAQVRRGEKPDFFPQGPATIDKYECWADEGPDKHNYKVNICINADGISCTPRCTDNPDKMIKMNQPFVVIGGRRYHLQCAANRYENVRWRKVDVPQVSKLKLTMASELQSRFSSHHGLRSDIEARQTAEEIFRNELRKSEEQIIRERLRGEGRGYRP